MISSYCRDGELLSAIFFSLRRKDSYSRRDVFARAHAHFQTRINLAASFFLANKRNSRVTATIDTGKSENGDIFNSSIIYRSRGVARVEKSFPKEITRNVVGSPICHLDYRESPTTFLTAVRTFTEKKEDIGREERLRRDTTEVGRELRCRV